MLIREFFFVSSFFIVFLLYLMLEKHYLDKKRSRIPLRICVTGSRGKSSVTRLIASSLREAGLCVVARTTGSKPVIIYPDGSEKEIVRKGFPSILEDKRILKLAEIFQAQAVVVELMSLEPDCLYAESSRILKPQILVITNVRLDHIAQMGRTTEEIAGSLSSAITSGCKVFIPESECFPAFRKAAGRVNSDIVEIQLHKSLEIIASGTDGGYFEFEQNLSLARAVCEFLGLERRKIIEGMKKVRSDFGSLKVWKISPASLSRDIFTVSAFAANDPESTINAFEIIREKISVKGKEIVGLLNLRSDRGDRTLQWQKEIGEGKLDCFNKLVLVGGHAVALKRSLRKVMRPKITVCQEKSPLDIMERLFAISSGDVVFVGMGNMGGAGKQLVSYWEKIGVPYAL